MAKPACYMFLLYMECFQGKLLRECDGYICSLNIPVMRYDYVIVVYYDVNSTLYKLSMYSVFQM